MCFCSTNYWTVFWTGNGFLGFLHPTFLRPQLTFSTPVYRDFCRSCKTHTFYAGVWVHRAKTSYTQTFTVSQSDVTAKKARSSYLSGLSAPELDTAAVNGMGNTDTLATFSKVRIH